jgi:hypothetical protein
MKIKTVDFQNDPIKYIVPSWNEMDHVIFSISKDIIQKDLKFDRVVTLAKGGWPMARPLVDYIQAKEVASIGLKYYSSINERLKEPEVYQDIPVDIEGETILLFDDVADTGESLAFVKEYLESRGVKKIYTATLFYKPHSSITPDFYGEETTAWIIFPYELRETMEVLVGKWKSEGLEETEIVDRFEDLGFSRTNVEYLYTLL